MASLLAAHEDGGWLLINIKHIWWSSRAAAVGEES